MLTLEKKIFPTTAAGTQTGNLLIISLAQTVTAVPAQTEYFSHCEAEFNFNRLLISSTVYCLLTCLLPLYMVFFYDKFHLKWFVNKFHFIIYCLLTTRRCVSEVFLKCRDTLFDAYFVRYHSYLIRGLEV